MDPFRLSTARASMSVRGSGCRLAAHGDKVASGRRYGARIPKAGAGIEDCGRGYNRARVATSCGFGTRRSGQ